MSLPPELSRLGEDLQKAARREVARRRRAWALRTAVAGAVLACLSAAFVPDELAPAIRGQAVVAANEPSRCTEPQNMRRSHCTDPPALMTAAAAGRESPTVVAHFGDAAQSGRERPPTGPGGFATLY